MTLSDVKPTPFNTEVILHWAQQAREQRNAFDAFADYLRLNPANRAQPGRSGPSRNPH